MKPTPRPGILGMKKYVGGASSVDGRSDIVKLSSNESALGPSPEAKKAMVEAALTLERYPAGDAPVLRAALSEKYDLDPEQLVIGSGSDEILSLLGQAYLAEGDDVLFSAHSFVMYKIIAQANSANPVMVADKSYRADVDALLDSVSEKTKLVFLANPNNPTGTYIPASEVRRLREGLREDVLLVVDAAYAEYVSEPDYEAGIELVRDFNNVVMTRTFSKIYGLAAVRLGWAFCPRDVADVLNTLRGPFNVNAVAQSAGVAALADQGFIDQVRAFNHKWLNWLAQELGGLGLEVTPSVANFVLIHFGDTPGKTAADANAFLLEKGFILRANAAEGLEQALRLTVGLEDHNRGVVAALKEFLERVSR